MEKRSPHYPLEALKALVRRNGLDAYTAIAKNNARLMGLDGAAALAVVLGLQRGHFYKSMTTHADHRVWQDVYHAPCPNGKLAYIKLTQQESRVVIQFKEK